MQIQGLTSHLRSRSPCGSPLLTKPGLKEPDVFEAARSASVLETSTAITQQPPSFIDNLPDEIFILIFSTMLREEDSKSRLFDTMEHPRIRATLSLVSRNWHRIVYFTPSLWTTILQSNSPAYINFALEKSGQMPLKAYLDSDYVTLPPSAEVACSQVHRWKFARISIGEHRPKYLTVPAPLLEEVEVRGLEGSTIDLFGGQAPRLKRIDLTAVSIPWSSGLFSGLEVLSLWMLRPAVDEIISILAASPSLQALKLIHCNIEPPAHDFHRSVRLSQLQQIIWCGMDSRVVGVLLDNIRSPPFQDLLIDCDMNREEMPDELGFKFLARLHYFLARHPQSLRPNKLEVKPSYMSYSSSANLIALRGDEPDVMIRRFGHQLPAEFRDMPTTLHWKSSSWGEEERHDARATVDAADLRMRITSLEIEEPSTEVEHVLNHLAAPQEGRWVLPYLQHLNIDLTHIPAGFLAKMVEARTAASEGEEGIRPTVITRLELQGTREIHEEDLVAVEKILDFGSVLVNGILRGEKTH